LFLNVRQWFVSRRSSGYGSIPGRFAESFALVSPVSRLFLWDRSLVPTTHLNPVLAFRISSTHLHLR
jgi:hypothetical protein